MCVQEDGESVPSQYIIDVEGGAHGQLGAGHLADHPSAVTALQGALKVGSPLGPLLVLERVEVRPNPYQFDHPALHFSVPLPGVVIVGSIYSCCMLVPQQPCQGSAATTLAACLAVAL